MIPSPAFGPKGPLFKFRNENNPPAGERQVMG